MDGTQICKMNKFFYFISFKIALFIGRLKINSKEAGGGPFPFPSKFHFLQEALSASSWLLLWISKERRSFVENKYWRNVHLVRWKLFDDVIGRKFNQRMLTCCIRESISEWPDWAIYWTLGNFLKPLATIDLPKFPTFLGIFCKGVKIYHLSSEIIFGQLL